MLSKEEIEKAKKEGYKIIGNFKKATTESTKDIFPKKAEAIKILLQYIEQLETKVKKSETDKQKLIEKLEEVLKEYEHIKANEDSAMNLYSKIRKIVKGEKIE